MCSKVSGYILSRTGSHRTLQPPVAVKSYRVMLLESYATYLKAIKLILTRQENRQLLFFNAKNLFDTYSVLFFLIPSTNNNLSMPKTFEFASHPNNQWAITTQLTFKRSVKERWLTTTGPKCKVGLNESRTSIPLSGPLSRRHMGHYVCRDGAHMSAGRFIDVSAGRYDLQCPIMR